MQLTHCMAPCMYVAHSLYGALYVAHSLYGALYAAHSLYGALYVAHSLYGALYAAHSLYGALYAAHSLYGALYAAHSLYGALCEGRHERQAQAAAGHHYRLDQLPATLEVLSHHQRGRITGHRDAHRCRREVKHGSLLGTSEIMNGLHRGHTQVMVRIRCLSQTWVIFVKHVILNNFYAMKKEQN